ncbi:MAG TPA: AbrB/MazE/SpoVT family DNA-binding domain-containing protein [Gammaproteobacteria bacterium]|nr:AbrB/MazE/SpoVT family DNA-binding domain-containing protein [Gammaproteobacteria bacterium]
MPKAIREELGLKAGQQFTVLTKGGAIELVPIPDMKKMRGILKGADTTGYRDHKDRY